MSRCGIAIVVLSAHLASAAVFAAEPGVSANQIKVGQTTSYSGPASQYGLIGKVQDAYFRMLNEKGGINGRKIELLSRDDAYSPPKSVEQLRKLVEDDEIAFMFNSFGGPTNAAQAKYLNRQKIPQLFVGTGAHYWGDVKEYPWSMGWQPSFRSEARAFARDAIDKNPSARIAVLYQNDDFGKDYLLGVKDVLDKQSSAKLISEFSYETSAPTIESQFVNVRAANPDVVVLAAVPKFAAQFVRKLVEMNWSPTVYVTGGASLVSVTTETVKGRSDLSLYTATFFKNWNDPNWRQDPSLAEYFDFMRKYMPGVRDDDFAPVYGYSVAQTLVDVLARCGDDLSRANIMKQASNVRHLALPLLAPGVVLNTGPDDHFPIEQIQLGKWDGSTWRPEGALISVR
ncbi:ABC transporter substrate-binding protein [Tardiphaga sp. 42S5]|uniref:ABC transporter substrate-binding protein n=1 Tax=Tardiphaga sp. 42S5 TaxID=1404799 RepID=UPI002A5AAB29|nr:ABC transporter substrate-binding protein [Tardiphaga sp. 42S5]WPO43248.1 ABC transporter substrate-binding protein [Tardiphaga sp. 42S5]